LIDRTSPLCPLKPELPSRVSLRVCMVGSRSNTPPTPKVSTSTRLNGLTSSSDILRGFEDILLLMYLAQGCNPRTHADGSEGSREAWLGSAFLSSLPSPLILPAGSSTLPLMASAAPRLLRMSDAWPIGRLVSMATASTSTTPHPCLGSSPCFGRPSVRR
jgi:hypothetical protein